jgi:hypothetical protein
MAMCAVLLVGAGGGGVAYAAEDAMPEDVLYPVKLHFNEPLVGAFHRSPERRADWEQRRLGRRLREAEHLSNRPEFTGKRREMLEQRIEKRVEVFQESIEKVPEEKRAEIEQRFQKRFDQHQDFLEKIEEGTVSKQEVQKFKQRMMDVHNRIKKPGMRSSKVDKNPIAPVRLDRKPPLDARLSEQKHTLDLGRGLQNTRKIVPSSLRKPAPKRLK